MLATPLRSRPTRPVVERVPSGKIMMLKSSAIVALASLITRLAPLGVWSTKMKPILSHAQPTKGILRIGALSTQRHGIWRYPAMTKTSRALI